jgi:hypothetical protein
MICSSVNLARFICPSFRRPDSKSPWRNSVGAGHYFIELDGDVHVPLYEKFEAELAELKAAADAKARAGERLAAYRRSGERKALVGNFGGDAPHLGASD